MKSIWTGVVCFAAGVLCLAAFQQSRVKVFADTAADQAPDQAKVERFLRRYYGWPTATWALTVSPFKASPMPGFVESHALAGPKDGRGQGVSQSFFMSTDGKFMLENAPIRMDGDPFRDNKEQIDLRNQPAFGSAVPRVTIVEYGDMQCSYCKQVVSVVRNDIPRDFGREVRVVFKDYPLYEIHPWAWDAASAGRCIYKQKPEAFWDFHDWAYEQQGRFNAEQFRKAAIAFANSRKVDTAKMTTCMASPDTRAEIERSLAEGRALHVTGTPTFFINGRFVEGSQTYAAMRQYIQSELEYLNGK